MKAILSKDYRSFGFYDRVLATGIECIMELIRINDDNEKIILGFKYTGSKTDKTVLQMIKIINSTSKVPMELYIETSNKLFKEIKEQKLTLTLKKINMFNRFKPFYIMKSDYIFHYIKSKYSRNEFYSDDILERIWDAYYNKEDDELDELENLL